MYATKHNSNTPDNYSVDDDADDDDCGKLKSEHCPDSGFLSSVLATEDDLTTSRDASESNILPSESSNLKSECNNYMRLDSGVDVSELLSSTTELQPEPEVGQDWELILSTDDDGDTQMHLAILHGLIDVVFALISRIPHPTLFNAQNDQGQTCLHLAVLTRQVQLIRRLVLVGSRLDTVDFNGNNAVHLACSSGDLTCLQELTRPVVKEELTNVKLRYEQPFPQPVHKWTFLDGVNYEGQSPLHLAAMAGHVELVRALAHLGANVNGQDEKGGRTAMHYAVERRLTVVAQCLIECGCELNLRDYAGRTPFQLAWICGETMLSDKLRSSGATAMDEFVDESETESEAEDEE